MKPKAHSHLYRSISPKQVPPFLQAGKSSWFTNEQ